MGINLSVVIPTYAPLTSRLQKTLDALKDQTLDKANWELIVVDNNTTPPIAVDLSWHQNAYLIKEAKQGLTFARLAGFSKAVSEIIVMVDDDNVLQRDYLEKVIEIFDQQPSVGVVGGKSLPMFEATPPTWLCEFESNLAIRNLGDEIIISKWASTYPKSAPIGAGMAIRKAALSKYLQMIENSDRSTITDRSGTSLSSGGDNEIVINALIDGWQCAYFPKLVLRHIIPQSRMQPNYLAELHNQTNASWVKLLAKYHICPWQKISPLTLNIRKLKAWFTYKAWSTPAAYVKWRGACGLLEGLASLS
ncbi:glycosyltransferase family 2 protein [Mucilaginibacter pallidiroseus]|uniref:Glycosyltransferase family 2 protein n=1 Tax=Mucilaginibacter pallidiroseus TaxID=2599295 RepID=A0A563U1B2_9SPHI|nr:glycosyltransferase [Mucilaginibacter pallidiroseus]TWR25190.1 glycosyltransferase family 2 protein [Mucilaginibacter pallidiroseus]